MLQQGYGLFCKEMKKLLAYFNKRTVDTVEWEIRKIYLGMVVLFVIEVLNLIF
jgi:hypothetical protein